MAVKATPKTKAGKRSKVKKVMHEYKEGELNIGKSDKKVQNRDQAIAIAMKQSGQSKDQAPAKKAAPKKKTVKKAAPKRKVAKKAVKKSAPKGKVTKKAAPRKKTAAKKTVKRAVKRKASKK